MTSGWFHAGGVATRPAPTPVPDGDETWTGDVADSVSIRTGFEWPTPSVYPVADTVTLKMTSVPRSAATGVYEVVVAPGIGVPSRSQA